MKIPHRFKQTASATLLIACALHIPTAHASSPDAWQEFHDGIAKLCTEAALPTMVNPSILIAPYGTESYGVAIAKGKVKNAKGAPGPKTVQIICVKDKASGNFEASVVLEPYRP